jgi:hypothetical protein
MNFGYGFHRILKAVLKTTSFAIGINVNPLDQNLFQQACVLTPSRHMGSSAWRKNPGNNCDGGLKKDDKVEKKCSQGAFSILCSLL